MDSHVESDISAAAPTSSRNAPGTKTTFDKEQLKQLKVKAGLKPYQSRTRLQQKDGKAVGIAPWNPAVEISVFKKNDGICYWKTLCNTQDKGDAITFIRRCDKLGFVSAVNLLAKETGFEITAIAIPEVCYDRRHMTLQEYAIWSYARQVSHDSGVFYRNGLRVITEFEGLSKSTFYRVSDQLEKKGWLVKIRDAKKLSDSRFVHGEYRVLTHEEWVKAHPGTCRMVEEEPSISIPTGGNGDDTSIPTGETVIPTGENVVPTGATLIPTGATIVPTSGNKHCRDALVGNICRSPSVRNLGGETTPLTCHSSGDSKEETPIGSTHPTVTQEKATSGSEVADAASARFSPLPADQEKTMAPAPGSPKAAAAAPPTQPNRRPGVLGSLVDSTNRPGVQGAMVCHIIPGSPADLVGMKRSDIVLSVDGQAIHSAHDYYALTRGRCAGEVVQIEWNDGSKIIQRQLELSSGAEQKKALTPSNDIFPF
jgi:hypothetical protein